MITTAQLRLNQSPILSGLLLGMGQGTMIAEKLFPRLPQALGSMSVGKMSNETLKRYNLRRAPGAPTKRIDIKFEGQVYTLDEYSVEIPLPRNLFREEDYLKRLNVAAYPALSEIAMTTANAILGLGYEIEVAELATTSGTYASGHVTALAGGTKWSAATGTPVTDVKAASNVVRKKIGKRPNRLTLSPDAKLAVDSNPEVKGYLPSTQMGGPSLAQLATIFEVEEILVGDAIWQDANDVGADVWGNNAVLAYVPKIGANGQGLSLTEPAFGFTNVIPDHPFGETPYYQAELKSWVYGATFERRANTAYNTAGFLFQNPK